MLQWLTNALISYGIWGILLLAFVDSAGIPVSAGMDALIIFLAVESPSQAYLGAAMAVLGSMCGNLILFWLARKGGSRFVSEVPQPGRPARFREWFQRYGLVTVFIPALVPIPLPLKVFVVSAGVLRTSLRSFVLVILTARVIRYFGEAYLGLKVGKDSVKFLSDHVWALVGIALGMFALIYIVLRFNEWRRSRPDRQLQ